MPKSKTTAQRATTKIATTPRAKRIADPQQMKQRGSKRPKVVQSNGRGVGGGFIAKPLRLPDGRVYASIGVMARGVGVGTMHLSNILRGRRNPSLNLAHRWAGFLGVSLDVLYGMLYGPGGLVPVDSPVVSKMREREVAARESSPVIH